MLLFLSDQTFSSLVYRCSGSYFLKCAYIVSRSLTPSNDGVYDVPDAIIIALEEAWNVAGFEDDNRMQLSYSAALDSNRPEYKYSFTVNFADDFEPRYAANISLSNISLIPCKPLALFLIHRVSAPTLPVMSVSFVASFLQALWPLLNKMMSFLLPLFGYIYTTLIFLFIRFHFRFSVYQLALLLLIWVPSAEACPKCVGDPLLGTAELPSLLCASLLTIATFNARGGLYAQEAARLKTFAASMIRNTIHALVITEARPAAESNPAHRARHFDEGQKWIKHVLKKYNITTIDTSTRTRTGRVTILLHPALAQHLAPQFTIENPDPDGRWLHVPLFFPHQQVLHLAGVYGDATSRMTPVQTRLTGRVTDLLADTGADPNAHLALCGDYNEVYHPQDTANPQRRTSLDTQGILAALEADISMTDTLRIHNPDTPAFTYIPPVATRSQDSSTHPPVDARARLDYIYMSSSLVHQGAHVAAGIDMCGQWLSFEHQDHFPVITQVSHFDHTISTPPPRTP